MVTDLPNNLKIPSNITYIQGTDGVWEPEFESDFDKAVYYAGKSPNPRSKNQKNVIKWIYSLGVSFDEIKDHRKKILEKLKDLTTKDGAWDDYPNVLVPPVFQSFSIEQDEEDELPEGLEELIKEVSEDEEDELPEGLEELLDTVRRTSVVSKKVDINRVLNRKPSETINPNNLKPEDTESENTEKKSDSDDFKKDVNDGINKILGSLITIKSLLDKQRNVEERTAKTERRSEEKREQKELENKLEKKKEEKTKKIPEVKPIGGFFDMIKRFFTNILIGGVVLKIFNWINDPNNKSSVERFKNFMVDNAPLILGGLLAIAALPLVSTILGFLAPITAIAIPAITAAFAFLTSPVGLIALATLAGVAVGYKGIEYATNKATEKAGKIIYGEGNVAKGRFITKLRDQYGRIAPKAEKEKMTGEEKTTAAFLKIYDDALVKRQKINDELYRLRTMSDDIRVRPKIKEKEKELEDKDKELRQMESQISIGGKTFSELKKQFEEKGEAGLPQTSLSKRLYPSQPKPQPQTPIVPGKETANKDDGRESSSETVAGSAKVVPASHPETGSGYTVQGQIDQNGRPVVFSNPAAQQFAKAVEDSGMNLGQYVASSGRSEAKNASLKGADPNSHHMYGEALDMNGAGYEWMKANGSKYGWRYVYNHGPGSAHFKYVGPGSGKTPKLSSPGSAPAPPSAQVERTPISPPSISSPTGRSGIGILPMPMGGGGSKGSTTGSGADQTKLPFFSSEDPNNMTMMVVKGIYNVVG
jgi:hypothetical protein